MPAEIHDSVIVATEHIKAPPEIVFPYFTDPALIVTWIGEQAELDPRPGGVFALDMGDVAAHGTYLVVEAPHRVVFSWGIPGDTTLPPAASTVEVVLTPDGDDTQAPFWQAPSRFVVSLSTGSYSGVQRTIPALLDVLRR